MSNEEILLDEIRTRCAELQTLIYDLKKGSPKAMDEKSISYLKIDLKNIKKEIHDKVYEYRLAQLDKELEK